MSRSRCALAAACAALAACLPASPAQADWQEPFLIDSFPATSAGADAASVAAGRSGATAVWQARVQVTGRGDTKSYVTAVRTASATPEGPIGSPATLSGEPPATADSPRVAADEAGTPTVLLIAQQPSIGARVAAGPPFASDRLVPISHPAVTSVSAVRLRVGPRGDALAVWNMSDGVLPRLQAAYRPAGGAWGPPTTVSPARFSNAVELVDFAVSDTGRAAMIYRLSFTETYAHWVAPSGHFGQRLKIDSSVMPVAVTFDRAGNLVGLFVSRRGAVKYGVMRPRRRRFGHPDALAPGGSNLVLGRGSEAASRLVAAWDRGSGTYQVSVASPEGRPGRPSALFDPVPVPGTCPPIVSSNARGDAVVGWCGPNGLMVSVQPAGESFGEPRIVSRGDRPGSLRTGSVAMDPAGRVIAVWTVPGAVKGAWFTPAPHRAAAAG